MEDIIINVSYNLFKNDYLLTKNAHETNDKSLIGNIVGNLTKEQYENLAKIYYESYSKNLTYTECEKLYIKLRRDYNNQLFVKLFFEEYNIKVAHDSLLIDAINNLKNKFPNRNWKQENIFILKTLENKNIKYIEKLIEIRKKYKEDKLKQNINVVSLKVKKKYTKEEILKGSNSKLIAATLNISKEEADKIVENNYNEEMKGVEFEPYVPE